MKQMDEDELLRLACIFAERDQEALVESYSHMPRDKTARSARAFVKRVRAYRVKRWGYTAGEVDMMNAKLRSVSSLRNIETAVG